MSRSIRHFPMVSDQQSGGKRVRDAKRSANRAVRVSEDVPNGKAYRKYSCSWDIVDYKCYWPEETKARRK